MKGEIIVSFIVVHDSNIGYWVFMMNVKIEYIFKIK